MWRTQLQFEIWQKRKVKVVNNLKSMKYIFRGHTVFEYIPNAQQDKVIQNRVSAVIPAFDFCHFINEDYKLLSQFFDTVYRHTQGEDVQLNDIIVN